MATIALIAAIYILPTVIAIAHERRQKAIIIFINLFLGWTVLGWLVAMIWSLFRDAPETNLT